jgi:hypothetical protein
LSQGKRTAPPNAHSTPLGKRQATAPSFLVVFHHRLEIGPVVAVVEWPDHSKTLLGYSVMNRFGLSWKKMRTISLPVLWLVPLFSLAKTHRRDSKRVDRMMRVYRPIDFQAHPVRP